MRNFFVPQSTQVDRVAARPFFMRDGLDVSRRGPWPTGPNGGTTQGAFSPGGGGGPGPALDAVNLNGFGRGGHRWTLQKGEWRRQLYPTIAAARPTRGQLLVFWSRLALMFPRAGYMEWSYRCGVGGRTVPPAVDVPGRLRCRLHTIRPSSLASRFREGRLLEPQGGHRPGKCGRQLMAIHITNAALVFA